MMYSMGITDNTSKSRYEIDFDGHIVFADYRKQGNVIHILHVEAPPALRGKGAAGTFMKAMMDDLREDGMKVAPVCGYAASWIQKHKEYHDMLS